MFKAHRNLKFQGEQKLCYPPSESADPEKGDTSVLLQCPVPSHLLDVLLDIKIIILK